MRKLSTNVAALPGLRLEKDDMQHDKESIIDCQ